MHRSVRTAAEPFDDSAKLALGDVVLIHFPCAAATAAVHRETALGWTIFVAAWTTRWAYVVAVALYRTATIARHPVTSALWIAGLTAVGAAALVMESCEWVRAATREAGA